MTFKWTMRTTRKKKRLILPTSDFFVVEPLTDFGLYAINDHSKVFDTTICIREIMRNR